ncbi:MAG TPA: caspase family protein [Tenuifilaceae bacterium]|nr:caspase family protein [Tenuifilaceae bacterium]
MKRSITLLLLLLGVFLSYGQVRLKQTLSDRKHQIVCVAYSPNSMMIATGGFDNNIILWDTQTGAEIRKLKGLSGFPLSVTFSKDSRYVLAGGKDSRITIWDANSGTLLRSLKGHKGDITSISIRDDNYIISASKDKTLRLWDFNGNFIREFVGHKREVMAVDFSNDGQRIASGSADGTVKEWDVSSGKELNSINAHDGWVRTVAYNNNSTLIASGGDDGKIQIWNRSTGELKNSIIAHSKWLESLSFSPDGRYIVSGGHDNYLVVVDANTGKMVFQSPRQDYYVLSTAFDPSGKHIISCAFQSSNLNVWDASSLGIRAALPQSEQPKEKPKITWKTATNQKTENLTYKINAIIKSDSPLSSVDIYLNSNRFVSQREFEKNVAPLELNFEQAVFLTEGNNTIKLMAYNDAGETTSETISVTFEQPKPAPKPEPVVAEVVQPKAEPEKTAKEAEKPTKEEQPVVKTQETPKADQKAAVVEPSLDELLANLPKNPVNPFRFALIFGNEDYSSYQTGLESEANVAYAINDATAFKEYALNILGVPPDNILFYTDARAIVMDNAIAKLNPIIKALGGRAEIFFYYAGHGFPDEKTREPYLIPVDVSGTNLRFAIKLKDLYESLTEHPSARITLVLDACFSGGAREQGLLSARAVRVKPKEDLLKGNIVVFSASSGSESSLPYKDKQHGLFTYYLLDKLKETKGNITYKELSDYLSAQVGVRSVMVNNKPQAPQTNISADAEQHWANWIFK